MRQVLITRQGVEVRDVPAPSNEAGNLLVMVDHSCISVGTEMSGVKESNMPLWKRAMKRPEQVKQVAELIVKEGIKNTQNLVKTKLNAAFPTGYSASGTVVEVGEGVKGFEVGDRVACAGAQCAHHAELIRVPVNLCVPVPDTVSGSAASTVALGAIAMQGIRRLEPTLGETFVVVGLGFLGQLSVQFLKASGSRVIGIDLDSRRIAEAEEQGLDCGLHTDDYESVSQIARLTDGYGADGVVVTAASPSNEILSNAFKMCRRKARVVLVGDVGLDINRADIYAKELDFLISTSYGPGRYDNNYEENGLDYPLPYVRWTENRNMSEYLRLIGEGRIDIQSALETIFPIDDAARAYKALGGDERPLLALLAYPQDEKNIQVKTVHLNRAPQKDKSVLGIAIIGAGGFAKSTHLPIAQKMNDIYRVRAIVSRKGHDADTTARQYQADYGTTNYEAVLGDENIDAVFITTRHDTHADLTLRALKAGKHVLVEKPLCLNKDELACIEEFYADGTDGKPVLLTGFNRRFSKYATAMSKALDGRSNPIIVNYRMNAGYIPLDHWVHTEAGGGRNLGEACHIYDLFTYLINAKLVSVNANAITPENAYYAKTDNFVMQAKFEDGSVASLTYTALGSKESAKEVADIYSDGRIIQLNDYKDLAGVGFKLGKVSSSIADKGHKEEIRAFGDAILKGREWPIPLWQQIQATRMALEVQKQIESQGPDTRLIKENSSCAE